MLSMGHEIVWLARYEGLKVVLRTIIFNLSRVSCNSNPRSRSIVLRSGYALGTFYENITRGRTQIFPFSIVQITRDSYLAELFLYDPGKFAPQFFYRN